jgi:hypothetical protein
MQHRGVLTALTFTMPIGATPSGPGPFPKNSNIAGGVLKVAQHADVARLPVAAGVPAGRSETVNSLSERKPDSRTPAGKSRAERGIIWLTVN